MAGENETNRSRRDSATEDKRPETQQQPQPVPIYIPDNLKAGCFSNNAYVEFNQEQFNLDFLSVGRLSNAVVGRIITSPGYFKHFTMLCIQQLKKYEEAFGEIRDIAPKKEKAGETPLR